MREKRTAAQILMDKWQQERAATGDDAFIKKLLKERIIDRELYDAATYLAGQRGLDAEKLHNDAVKFAKKQLGEEHWTTTRNAFIDEKQRKERQ